MLSVPHAWAQHSKPSKNDINADVLDFTDVVKLTKRYLDQRSAWRFNIKAEIVAQSFVEHFEWYLKTQFAAVLRSMELLRDVHCLNPYDGKLYYLFDYTEIQDLLESFSDRIKSDVTLAGFIPACTYYQKHKFVTRDYYLYTYTKAHTALLDYWLEKSLIFRPDSMVIIPTML